MKREKISPKDLQENPAFNETLPRWAASWLSKNPRPPYLPAEEKEKNQRTILFWLKKVGVLKIGNLIDIAHLNPLGPKGETSKIMRENFLRERIPKSFTYPHLEGQNFSAYITAVKKMHEDLEKSKEEKSLKKIIGDYLSSVLVRLEFLQAVREKNEEKSFLAAKSAYRDITPEFIAYERVQLKKLAEENVPNQRMAEKWSAVLKPTDIKAAFLWCLRRMWIPVRAKKEYPPTDGWFVGMNTNQNTYVSALERNIFVGDAPKKLDDCLALINHEIGIHTITIENTWDAGLCGFPLGNEEEYILVQEGLATWWESESMEEIFGIKPNPHWPFYGLAMEFAKTNNADFSEIYWSVFYRMLAFHRKLDRLTKERGLPPKWKSDEELIQETQEKSWKVACRVRRGSQPEWRGWYVAKDRCYDEGCMLVKNLARYGLENRLVLLRADPEILSDAESLGLKPDHPRRIENIAKVWWNEVGKISYGK